MHINKNKISYKIVLKGCFQPFSKYIIYTDKENIGQSVFDVLNFKKNKYGIVEAFYRYRMLDQVINEIKVDNKFSFYFGFDLIFDGYINYKEPGLYKICRYTSKREHLIIPNRFYYPSIIATHNVPSGSKCWQIIYKNHNYLYCVSHTSYIERGTKENIKKVLSEIKFERIKTIIQNEEI